MAGFVQVIEYTTSRFDEMQALMQEWRASHPDMGPVRVSVTKDRDREGAYCSIVEFSSYEEAMRNSEDPLTTEFSQRMQALADGPPTFRNLDVVQTEVRIEAQGQAQRATTDA